MNIILIGLTLLLFSACKQDTDLYTEVVTEVFNVIESPDEPKLGAMQFSDSYIYDNSGKEIQYRIYNPDGSIKGIEVKDYESGALPAKSSFFDENNQLLSYYKLEYDEKDNLSRKLGFDANNDELLRIEVYHYDDQGNRVAKEIRSADDQIQNIIDFSHDKYGNEISVSMRNDKNEEYYKENYEISSRNKEQEWTQRWGMIDGKPKSYTIKRKKTLKKIERK